MRPYSTLMGAMLTIGLSAWAASGCQVIGGFEDFSSAAGGASGSAGSSGAGGTAGTSGTAGTAGTGGTNTTPCDPTDAPGTAGRGPEMKGIRLTTGACVWVDSTEVTLGQYKTFTDSNPSPAIQDQYCSWNTAFLPDQDCLALPDDIQLLDVDYAPVACVDQCDARAFCEWAGKKLCSTNYAGKRTPESDPWLAACAGAEGLRDFPYGSQALAEVCNGSDHPSSGCPGGCIDFPAGALTSCKNPEGVFDLVGNLAEWSDGCSGILGGADLCLVRGGWVARPAAQNTCKSDVTATRQTLSPHIGFRCCGP